jgi:DNA-binding response OmpR family regulator
MSSEETFNSRLTGSIAHQILVVEDDVDTAEFLKVLLEEHGYRVTIAKDGGQAQSSFVMRKPDFVILDLILPGESGFEICERMKQWEKNVPIIVLTGIDSEESRDLATRVGADDYLTKPFDTELLLEKIPYIAQKVWEKSHLDKPKKEEDRFRFSCVCGKRFKVSPKHRGKTLTCSDCGETILIPRHD